MVLGRVFALASGLLLGGLAPAADRARSSPWDGENWTAQLRYRVEAVDEDRAIKSATASTLRTHLGYQTNPELAIAALLEVEDVHALGAEKFNSTTNGHNEYSVVADPDGTELNQAYLTLQRSGARARLGRQSFVLDNQRFFGDVDFRQNQQTVDAATLQATTPGGSRFIYSYLSRVHRFFGEDHPLGELDLSTHVLNYSLGRMNGDRLTAYAYLLEFDEAPFNAASTQTFGASYDGTFDIAARKLLYRAEFANQSDYADNPGSVNEWYGNVEIGLKFANQFVATAGAELLGGNGQTAFQTPLATLHKFNGYADIFAGATPPNGLEDRYLRFYAPIAGTRFTVTLHDFHSNHDNQDYGTEVDAELYWRINTTWLIGAKYANYNAEDFAVDTRKGWLWVQADF
jgi:Alginate export